MSNISTKTRVTNLVINYTVENKYWSSLKENRIGSHGKNYYLKIQIKKKDEWISILHEVIAIETERFLRNKKLKVSQTFLLVDQVNWIVSFIIIVHLDNFL